MEISAEISFYPLSGNYVDEIKDFIRDFRRAPGLTVVTNQMSTQVTGDFDAVTEAISRGMRRSMESDHTSVFIVKYLSRSLDIVRAPSVATEAR